MSKYPSLYRGRGGIRDQWQLPTWKVDGTQPRRICCPHLDLGSVELGKRVIAEESMYKADNPQPRAKYSRSTNLELKTSRGAIEVRMPRDERVVESNWVAIALREGTSFFFSFSFFFFLFLLNDLRPPRSFRLLEGNRRVIVYAQQ